MQALASLLNPAATHQTQAIWQRLEQTCGLAGIKMTPLPHFSWQGAEEYNQDRVEEIVHGLVTRITPFTVVANNLGIFPGRNPVLYLGLAKSRRLLEFHEMIWKAVEPEAMRPNPHYRPDNWIPHITLAYRDVNPNNLACAVQELAFQPVWLEIQVDHLALIYEQESRIGIRFRYDFLRPD